MTLHVQVYMNVGLIAHVYFTPVVVSIGGDVFFLFKLVVFVVVVL